MSEVYAQPIAELGGHVEAIKDATFKMYDKTSRMSRRQLITNGIYSYYIDMVLPHLRKAGLYDEACEKYDFWEIDRRISEMYYEVPKRNFVQAVVPQKLFTGVGALPVPGERRPGRRSKYAYL